MAILAINHDVEDFDAWKKVYDDFPKQRLGVRFARVNRNVDDPNNITVIHGFESVDAARAFVQNTELKGAMAQAGVSGAPRIELFEEVESLTF
jgi:hypothetical protein